MDNLKSEPNQNESPKKSNSKSLTPVFTIISSHTRKTYGGSEHPSKRWGHSVILYNKSMIIFGGRHLQRSLSNIYSLDFTTLTWAKIDPNCNPPPARDSHSAVLYNNSDMIIFGGNGSTGKLNDLWNFNFNDKKWNKIITEGPTPSARDGHLSSLIYNKYMVIYAGLDDKDEVVNDIFLFDINNNKWIECELEGNIPQNKDGQSCCLVEDIMYLFGGQGPEDDEYSNDLFTLTVDINENLKLKPKANIQLVEISNNIRPKERASQSCVAYKEQYLIITGGEGKKKEPLDDIWIFDIKNKCYTKVELNGNDKIDGRFCHTCIIYGDILALYGGMKNSEITLDNLTVLSIELNQNKKTYNKNNNKYLETLNNNKRKKIGENNNSSNNKNKEEEDINKDNKIEMIDFSTDTNDLLNMDFFSFEEIKKNYLNNLMTWQFLKNLSNFYKWPIGCIGNFIKNSLKDYVYSKNIYIDIKKIQNDELLLSIKDDGKGISCIDFNGIMFSFIKNQNKELNYFQYGFSMKATAMRLADSFLIISKTSKEVSIGMISKELQKKINDSDYILTPIVNYRIEKKLETNNMKYIPKSNYPSESINLILDIIKFLFKDIEDLMKYFDSFDTGTHIYLFNLKTNDKKDVGYLKCNIKDKNLNNYAGNIYSNYELLFDEEENDIYLNEDYEFNENIKKNIISLKKYFFIWNNHNSNKRGTSAHSHQNKNLNKVNNLDNLNMNTIQDNLVTEKNRNSSNKKHIKIRYKKSFTSFNTLCSNSFDRKNMSVGFKKMKIIKKLSENYNCISSLSCTSLINNSNYKNKCFNKINKDIFIKKTISLVNKLEFKSKLFKHFRHWKKIKK
jgi:hypothetical protein